MAFALCKESYRSWRWIPLVKDLSIMHMVCFKSPGQAREQRKMGEEEKGKGEERGRGERRERELYIMYGTFLFIFTDFLDIWRGR